MKILNKKMTEIKNSLSEKEMEESGKRLLDSKQPVLKLSQILEIEKERQAVAI